MNDDDSYARLRKGKYWHRHRRPRPVEYNSDPDFHNGVKRESELAKTTAAIKKKGGAAALRAQSSTLPHTPAETSEPQTPSQSNREVDASARQSPAPAIGPSEDDKPLSPVSTASSASEPPLAQRIKVNGASSHTKHATPGSPTPAPSAAPAPVTPTPAPTKPDVSPNKPTPTPLAIVEKTKHTEPASAPLSSPTRPYVCA